TGVRSRRDYPEKLRRIKFRDTDTGNTLDFLTNNFVLSAPTIADLYRCRWQVELFFKWIKQNLRIKSFYGTSENAVKSQIWIAVSVYVIVAIMKKQLHLQDSLYTLLQVLSVTIFERTPIYQLLTERDCRTVQAPNRKQLKLFN
ncbi:MAG: transposase, partial [Desulfurivibrio sp.]